jgi:hypothetical protein
MEIPALELSPLGTARSIAASCEREIFGDETVCRGGQSVSRDRKIWNTRVVVKSERGARFASYLTPGTWIRRRRIDEVTLFYAEVRRKVKRRPEKGQERLTVTI